MRGQIPRTPAVRALDGEATALSLPDDSADAAWLSLVIHHIPDLEAAARAIETFPSLEDTCEAFAAAGFRQEALEPVRETYADSLADFLGQLDTFRQADTTMPPRRGGVPPREGTSAPGRRGCRGSGELGASKQLA